MLAVEFCLVLHIHSMRLTVAIAICNYVIVLKLRQVLRRTPSSPPQFLVLNASKI